MPLSYRPFDSDDLEEVCKVFVASLNAMAAAFGHPPYVDPDDPVAWDVVWERDRRRVFEHLNKTKSAAWLAEDEGHILGYARSILRSGHCELTEFFVRPEVQSTGIGQELLARAFLEIEAKHRHVIATINPGALARYLKAGLRPGTTIFDLEKSPAPETVETDLEIQPLETGSANMDALDRIDRTVIGHTRRTDHIWLIGNRRGFLCVRSGVPVGYGYSGRSAGPIAVLDSRDMPAALAHAEVLASHETDLMSFMVPITNQAAIGHLLARGFRFEPFPPQIFMTTDREPDFSRYILARRALFA